MSQPKEVSAEELRRSTIPALHAAWQTWDDALPADAVAWPKGAAYVRESSPESLVGDAPVVQLQNTLKMLQAERIYVPRELIFFENVSGTELAARLEFQDLIERAIAGEFAFIGAYLSNRLFRNVEDAIAVKRRLRVHQVRLLWVGKPSVNAIDPSRWAMERNLEIIDEWHSRQTGYRPMMVDNWRPSAERRCQGLASGRRRHLVLRGAECVTNEALKVGAPNAQRRPLAGAMHLRR